MCLYYNTVAFKKQYPAILFWRGLTHMRSMCVGVAETGGINTYAKHCLIPRRPAMIHKVTFLLLVLLHDQEEGLGWRSHL